MGPCFAMFERPPKLTTGYWDFRGLGAPMRMMCAYARAQCEDVKYAARQKPKGGWIAPEWEKGHKLKLREQNPLVQLPYVVNHTSGEVVAQSNAVYLYLGRLFGLNGRTREEQLANEQVLFHLHGMWMEMRDLVYPSYANGDEQAFKDSLQGHFSTTLPAHYEKMESWLRNRGTEFFASSTPCTADFHVWEMLDQQEAMARTHSFKSPLADFPQLEVFYRRFRQQPRLRSYFEGGDSRLPINNKMAFFK